MYLLRKLIFNKNYLNNTYLNSIMVSLIILMIYSLKFDFKALTFQNLKIFLYLISMDY